MDYRKVIKGPWIKAKIRELSEEFVRFLEDEKQQICDPIFEKSKERANQGDSSSS